MNSDKLAITLNLNLTKMKNQCDKTLFQNFLIAELVNYKGLCHANKLLSTITNKRTWKLLDIVCSRTQLTLSIDKIVKVPTINSTVVNFLKRETMPDFVYVALYKIKKIINLLFETCSVSSSFLKTIIIFYAYFLRKYQ